MEGTSEHHARLEDPAVPLALEEHSSPVHRPAVEMPSVVKLTRQQKDLIAFWLHVASSCHIAAQPYSCRPYPARSRIEARIGRPSRSNR